MAKSYLRFGCLGEVMLELALGVGTSAELGVAGDTYNTAVYLAHEQPNLSVEYITGLGTDGFSQRIRKHMMQFRIGTDRTFVSPTRHPGLYAIETDQNGERGFTYWRTASAARCLGDPDMPAISKLLKGLTHLYFSGISLAILAQDNRDRLFAAIADFRSEGGIVAFDSNFRPNLWGDVDLARYETERAWSCCDIAMPSIDDEMVLFDDATESEVLRRFERYDISKGTLKRGKRGPIGLDGVIAKTRVLPKAVIDTTAAGDSFNAAYLAALLDGQSNVEAMIAGHALACRVVAKKGAIIFKKESSS